MKCSQCKEYWLCKMVADGLGDYAMKIQCPYYGCYPLFLDDLNGPKRSVPTKSNNILYDKGTAI
jgi:hypothetical protein